MTHTTESAASAGIFQHVASRTEAIAHFRGRLAFESDVSDVAAALREAVPGFTLIDTRSDDAWAQGRVPGAMHLPRAQIAAEAASLVPAGSPVVVYCWGPGCNGATRAALEFALLGYPVKEMIGGFEYWVREGFPFETTDGPAQLPPDALTNVASTGLAPGAVTNHGISCAC